MPTDRTPQDPQVPCTEIAPTGSSSFRTRSIKNTEATTNTPATAPISTAPSELTKAQGAVIATRPASIPLHIMDGSGFLNFHIIVSVENSAPEAEASIVLTAMIAMRLSVAESVDPGLKPN